jgi:hypothetical protein
LSPGGYSANMRGFPELPPNGAEMPSRRELANAIRALSMDAVQKANSGHPGMPMGMADIAEVLWNDYTCRYKHFIRWHRSYIRYLPDQS